MYGQVKAWVSMCTVLPVRTRWEAGPGVKVPANMRDTHTASGELIAPLPRPRYKHLLKQFDLLLFQDQISRLHLMSRLTNDEFAEITLW